MSFRSSFFEEFIMLLSTFYRFHSNSDRPLEHTNLLNLVNSLTTVSL